VAATVGVVPFVVGVGVGLPALAGVLWVAVSPVRPQPDGTGTTASTPAD
jgi:hypothetical protein